jgi:hypothetical protein
MRHRSKVKPDPNVIAVFLQFSVREVRAIISDDAMWDAESHHEAANKL